MKHSLKIITAGLLASLAFQANAQAESGYHIASFTADHRTKAMEVHVWYPADKTGKADKIGSNAVFVGTTVQHDATPLSGNHPVVLLSHGSGGNAANLGWIAGHLADKGIIVIAPNHPGTTSGDSLQSETVKTWMRPADFTSILDNLARVLPKGVNANAQAVSAVGFSYGGYTVNALAGARISKARYIDYCKENAGMHDCGWLAAGKVDLTKTDKTLFEQSNKDDRIKSVIAIDAAMAQAYVPESLEAISVPVSLINLGDQTEVPAAINSSNMVPHMPNAEFHSVTGATHFSFLGECTFKGKFILMAIGEDPLCTKASDRARSDIHDELKSLITGFLQKQIGHSG